MLALKVRSGEFRYRNLRLDKINSVNCLQKLEYQETLNLDGTKLRNLKIRIVDKTVAANTEMVPGNYADLISLLWTGRRYGWISDRCMAYAVIEAVLGLDEEFQFTMMKHLNLCDKTLCTIPRKARC